MATVTVSSDTNYSSLTVADGDTLSITTGATLTINQTTAILEDLLMTTNLNTVLVENTSTTTPIFLRGGHSSGSKFDIEDQSTLRVRGDWISVGTSDGTASQTFTAPQDAGGNNYDAVGIIQVDDSGTLHTFMQVTALTSKFGDEKLGAVFTYDNSTRTITFGDGTNGYIPPNGADIKIPNIEIQNAGGNTLEIETSTSGNLDWDKCCASNIRFDTAFNCGDMVFQDVGIHEPDNGFDTNAPTGICDIDRMTIYSTTNDILFNCKYQDADINDIFVYSDVDAGTSGIVIIGAFNNTVDTVRVISKGCTSPSSTRPTLLVEDTGHVISNVWIAQSDRGSIVFQFAGNCTLSNLYFQGEGERGHASRARAFIRYNTANNCNVNGIESYPNSSDYVAPLTEYISTNEATACTVEGLTVHTASASSTQYIVFFGTDNGVTIKDFTIRGQFTVGTMRTQITSTNMVLNNWKLETTQSGSPQLFELPGSELDHISVATTAPRIGNNVRSATLFTTEGDYTDGMIALRPYYRANDSAVSIVSGVATDFVALSDALVIPTSGSEVQVDSRVIRGVTSLDSLSILGTSTSHFDFEFCMRVRGGTFGSFQDMTLVNLQSAFAALSGYDSDEGFEIRYRCAKNTAGITAEITRVQIGCTFDAAFSPGVTKQVTVTAPNLVDGSRVELYNVTQDKSINNSLVSGGSGYSIEMEVGANADAVVGDTLRLRATFQSGTSHKLPLSVVALANDTGVTFIDSQENWTLMDNIGIDGSAVTEFTSDFVNVQIDSDDADGETQKKRIVAWFGYIVTTELGIANFFGAIDLIDDANAQIITSAVNLKLQNVGSVPLMLTDFGYNLRTDDDSNPIAATGNLQPITWYGQYTSPVNNDSKEDIADAVWDEVASGHVTAGTTGKLLKDAKSLSEAAL